MKPIDLCIEDTRIVHMDYQQRCARLFYDDEKDCIAVLAQFLAAGLAVAVNITTTMVRVATNVTITLPNILGSGAAAVLYYARRFSIPRVAVPNCDAVAVSEAVTVQSAQSTFIQPHPVHKKLTDWIQDFQPTNIALKHRTNLQKISLPVFLAGVQ